MYVLTATDRRGRSEMDRTLGGVSPGDEHPHGVYILVSIVPISEISQTNSLSIKWHPALVSLPVFTIARPDPTALLELAPACSKSVLHVGDIAITVNECDVAGALQPRLAMRRIPLTRVRAGTLRY